MDGNASSEGRTVDDHHFVRPDQNTIIPSQLTGNSPNVPASSLPGNFGYIPEDSCDSILSFDDQDDDDDDDSVELCGKSLSSQTNRPYQGSLSGKIAKSQEPSAVEELQALMQSVRETSANSKDSSDNSPDGEDTEGSSMEVEYQRASVPNLEMVEQPEESYRARYESEGCRGPIRGVNENGFPTVKVNGYSGNVVMTVFLVTKSGEPHLHSITGPGSTKTICKDVTLKDDISGIQTWIGPEQHMIAVWDSLSVRRMRNWDADKKLRDRGEDPAAWKNKKKEARLMFQCTVPQTAERPGYILTCQSRPFLCTAPSGNPEIWWMSEKESPAKGGKEIAIIGKKFSTGFRVRFYGSDAEGPWEALAEVDKAKSHQGAAVFKIPSYKAANIEKPVQVFVEVRVGPEKDKRCSDSIPFSYVPENEAGDDRVTSSCSKCNSIKDALSHLFTTDSKEVKDEPYQESTKTSLEPERKRSATVEAVRDLESNEGMEIQPQSVNCITSQEEERSRIIEQIKRLQSPSDVQATEAAQPRTPPGDGNRNEHGVNQLKTSFPEFTVPSQSLSISRTTSLPLSYQAGHTVGYILQNRAVAPQVTVLPSTASAGTVLPGHSSVIITSNQPVAFPAQMSVQQGQNIRLVPATVPITSQQPIRVCVVDNQNFVRAYAPIAVQQGQPVQPGNSTQHLQYFQSVQPTQTIHQPRQTFTLPNNQAQPQIHSLQQQQQQRQHLVQAQAPQYIQQIQAPNNQISQIQLSTKGTLVHVRPNMPSTPQATKAAEMVVMPSSSIMNALQQIRVKQEPTEIKQTCAATFTSSNVPQINNVWSCNAEVSSPTIQYFNALPVQQTTINRSTGWNDNFSGSGGNQQMSQTQAAVAQSSNFLPSESVLRQLLLQRSQGLPGNNVHSNNDIRLTSMPSGIIAAPAPSNISAAQAHNVSFSSSPYILSSGQLMQTNSQTETELAKQSMGSSMPQHAIHSNQVQIAGTSMPSGNVQIINTSQHAFAQTDSNSQNITSIGAVLTLGSSAYTQETPSFIQGIGSSTFTQETPSFAQGIGSSAFTQETPSFAQGIGSSAFTQETPSFAQGIGSSTFTQETPSFAQGIGSSAFTQETPSFAQGIGSSAFTQETPSFAQGIGSSAFTQETSSLSQGICSSAFTQETQSFIQGIGSSAFTQETSSLSQGISSSAFTQETSSFTQGIGNSSFAQETSSLSQGISSSAFTQETPSFSTEQSSLTQQLNNNFQSTGNPELSRESASHPLAVEDSMGQGNLSNISFNQVNIQPASQAPYHFTENSVTENVAAVSQSSHLQMQSNECWMATSQAANIDSNLSQSIVEPEKVVGSALAQDLNRLSVEGSYLQSRSEPVNIQCSTNQVSMRSENNTPIFCDPQPMSLTEDPIPEELLNKLVKEHSDRQQLRSGYNSSVTEDRPGQKFIDEARNILLDTEQHQLADSFLVPQKNPVQDLAQFDQMQQKGAHQLVEQYISQLEQLKSLSEQPNVVPYTSDYNSAKTVTESFPDRSNANNQMQATGDQVSSSYQQTFQAAREDMLSNAISGNDNSNVLDVASQSNSVNELHTSSSAVWHAQSPALNDKSVEEELNTSWNANSNPNLAIPLQGDQVHQNSPLSSAARDTQVETVYIADTNSNSMDITETFDARNVSSQPLQYQQNMEPAENISYSFQSQFQASSPVGAMHISQKQQQQLQQQQLQQQQLQQQQQQQFEQSTLDGNSQQLYQNNAAAAAAEIQQQISPSQHSNDAMLISNESKASVRSEEVYAQQMSGIVSSESSEEERQALQKIPFTVAETKLSEWNELVEDTGKLLNEGLINQKEAQTIYSCVQQEDNLLLEMYRTSKKGSEDTGKVIETLKHWVLNVKHVSA